MIAQTHHTLSLVIGAMTILQDDDGRYSLRDLHNAAGGEKRHQPNSFLRLAQTQEFIEALVNSANSRSLRTESSGEGDALPAQLEPFKTTEGRSGGTFVVKELVYAYAMWISAAFSLRVIRAYDAMVMTGRGRNLSVDMSVNNWKGLMSLGRGMLKDLASCADLGVAQGIYGALLHVNRVCGVTTPPLDRLAPGLRQQILNLEGGAA